MGKQSIIDARRAGQAGAELMPHGGRVALAETAKALVERAGDRMRESFAEDHEFIGKFVATLKAGALDRDRTCVNVVSRIYRLVDEERKLVIEFVHSLGASSEEELRRMVDAVRAAEGADVLDGVERASAYLEAALQIHPEQRDVVVRRLGGVVPVEQAPRVGGE